VLEATSFWLCHCGNMGELADLVLVCVAAVQDCQAMQVDILENLLQ
jgi:hypothetical protein